MFLVNRFFILTLIVTNVSVNFVHSDETTEHFSNSTELDPLPQTKVTSGLISILVRILFGGYSSTARTNCNCKCGRSNNGYYQQRIVGGQASMPYKYPWMARLYYLYMFRCGGSLINDRYVLTAAHCTDVFFTSMLYVRLGSHNNCDRSSHEWYSYASRVVSPQFSSWPIFGQDISLIRLQNPAPINQFISPICLPDTMNFEGYHSSYAYRMGTVAGWGSTRQQGPTSCNLRDVNVPILSNTQCFEETNYKNISDILLTDYMMCAGYLQGGYDSCQGDSGGPLMVQRHDRRFEIVGVVSWGFGCAQTGFPGVYTRVTKQLNWIRQNTRDGCYCQN